MKFHLDFDIKKMQPPLHHRDAMLLIGSCFTESMGEKLRKHQFTTLENPNGILFNPVSVVEAIQAIMQNRQCSEADLFYYNECWHSWKHHSRFSGITAEECLSKINFATNTAHHFLKKANCIFITLGSAWLYTLTENALNAQTGSVAANNHKAPADWFLKRLMTLDETTNLLSGMLEELKIFNPNLRVVFTISPVRHLREGLVENNRSKAILIQAVHQLVEQNQALYYFPAYELVIDDLRDYRFYAEDMVHPNYQATQYVWEKFTEACMGEETRFLLKDIAEINLSYQHKPFNPSTVAHQKFLQQCYEKTKSLQEKYPFLNFEKELAYFKSSQS